MSDRGVSETLGFILVFSLVVTTIGIVYVSGFGGLQHAQQAEKVENVERAFDVLADNLEHVYLDGVPSRATEIKLAGGTLGTGDPVTIEVRAENSSDPMDNVTYTAKPEPIVYEDDGGSALRYTSGAVIRSDPGGAVMLVEPAWVNRSDRSAIPLVSTYGDDGIGGEGTVLLVAEGGSRSVQGPFEVATGSTAVVTVTVTSPRAAVWGRFFADRGFQAVDANPDDGDVSYRFETDSLVVTRTSVEVELES